MGNQGATATIATTETTETINLSLLTKKFIVSKTYDCVTPESAEDGDTSDNGFVWEDQEYTFLELAKLLRDECIVDEDCGRADFDGFISDYSIAETTSEAIHVDDISQAEWNQLMLLVRMENSAFRFYSDLSAE